MVWPLSLLLALPLALGLRHGPASSQVPELAPSSCPVATAEQSLPLDGPPLTPAPPGPSLEIPPGEVHAGDYRQRLRSTPLGWARLDHWCVWVEPPALEGAAALWDGRWHRAVLEAVATWAKLLPITLVNDPDRAQIRIQRRRPPLQEIDGRLRASHGRALLRLVQVERLGRWRSEPQVAVLIGSGQGAVALQATALHELGHALGLWGHSDRPGDAMAAVPGPTPVLALSERDRRTLVWLYNQPTRFGRPEALINGSGSRQ